MKILQHFEEQKEGGFIIFLLKDADWDDFLIKIPPQYKDCFISKQDLEDRIKIFNSEKEKEFSEILPTEPTIQSGDFGEILAYFLFMEIYAEEAVSGPKKWRWKENQNVSAPYSDVILFSIKNDEYSKDDLLISVESKMKAVASAHSPIESAFNGAKRDHTSRIAKSLSWLRKKYKDEALKRGADADEFISLVKTMNRFIRSEKYVEYTKKVKAIAFIDKDFLDAEKEKKFDITAASGMDLEMYVVGIKNLKGVYEKVYAEIPKL